MEGMGEVRTECVVSGFNRGVHRTESSSFVHITESQAQRCKAFAHYRAKRHIEQTYICWLYRRFMWQEKRAFYQAKKDLLRECKRRSSIVHRPQERWKLERMVTAQLHGDRRGVQSRNESELNLFCNCISIVSNLWKIHQIQQIQNRFARFNIDSLDSK